LAASARAETAPRLDVAERVIERLAGAAETERTGVLAWTAAACGAGAVLTVVVALQAWFDFGDPMTELMRAMDGVVL